MQPSKPTVRFAEEEPISETVNEEIVVAKKQVLNR